jgi:hypothetical protein
MLSAAENAGTTPRLFEETGELAQLRVKDLRQDHESGQSLFDIGTEDGRSMKMASSRREGSRSFGRIEVTPYP